VFETPLSEWDGCTSTAAGNGYLGHFNGAFRQNSDFFDAVNMSNAYNTDSYTEGYIANTQFSPVGRAGSGPSPGFVSPASGVVRARGVAYGSGARSLGFGAISRCLSEFGAPIEEVGLPGSVRCPVYGAAGSSGEPRKAE
jgi:hypothetical protein